MPLSFLTKQFCTIPYSLRKLPRDVALGPECRVRSELFHTVVLSRILKSPVRRHEGVLGIALYQGTKMQRAGWRHGGERKGWVQETPDLNEH